MPKGLAPAPARVQSAAAETDVVPDVLRAVHNEMKKHTGSGVGGAVALVIALFVGMASPFITSSEVGGLYTRRGQEPPVTGKTGLWYLPGFFILVGPVVWFVKTNNALNAYWESQGVRS